MKTINFLFAIAACVLLSSCGHHRDGTSVWAEGLGIIPAILFAGSSIFFVQAYLASRSNSTQQTASGIKDNTGNVPIYQLGKFWFGVALFVAAHVVIIVVNSER